MTGFVALRIAYNNAKKDLKIVELNQKKDIRIAIFENKSKIINDIAEIIEEYFNAADELVSHPLGNILVHRDNSKSAVAIDKDRFSPAMETLNEKYKNKGRALSKIKMLGITEAESAILKHENVIRKFQTKAVDLIHDENSVITLKEAQEFKEDAQKASSEFYTALSEYGETLKD
ncbi:hypothetical protein [Colwellia sp. 20A7]|uniref:hypothetical protein n=1 Tax=Colwellia sp. 20A7 TaxID=2689569 RepID=UPI001359B74B|nr:hypothetical protein [Colwellia sp. 20A7]